MPSLGEALLKALRPDSSLWRRAIAAGVAFGPDAFVRYSPPLFGLAFGAALSRERRIIRNNLRRILGPRSSVAELADVAAVFSNYASCLTEALLVGSNRGYRLQSHSRGVERYHQCAAAGRGVIIATAHTGGWEVAGPVLSGVHQGEVIMVMQRERDERARAIQDRARHRAGVKVVHIGDGALDALPLLGCLRRGAVVAMQIDRLPPGMRSRTSSLFGEPWQVPEGPLTLAAVSGAPILPVFTRRLAFMQYEAVVGDPIRLPRRPSAAELDGAANELTRAMERFVRSNPTQWFHFV
jgi:phosphatidylinositol dimannoside acyltransferase